MQGYYNTQNFGKYITRDYNINFNQSVELGSNIQAFATFTVFEIAYNSKLDSEFLGATETYVTLRISMPSSGMTVLKGYVIIYNGDLSKK